MPLIPEGRADERTEAGYIGLGSEAQGSPTGETFDSVAITLFLDSDALQLAQQTAAHQRDGVP